MVDHCHYVEGKEEKEEEKVSMILIPQTIVDKCAVVVETLYAFIAIVAMHGVLWPQIFTVDTDVV